MSNTVPVVIRQTAEKEGKYSVGFSGLEHRKEKTKAGIVRVFLIYIPEEEANELHERFKKKDPCVCKEIMELLDNESEVMN